MLGEKVTGGEGSVSRTFTEQVVCPSQGLGHDFSHILVSN